MPSSYLNKHFSKKLNFSDEKLKKTKKKTLPKYNFSKEKSQLTENKESENEDN